jgi:hypothetical protein
VVNLYFVVVALPGIYLLMTVAIFAPRLFSSSSSRIRSEEALSTPPHNQQIAVIRVRKDTQLRVNR